MTKHTFVSVKPRPRCVRTSKFCLNTTIGADVLCAWQPVLGITWVQTRSPQHARKLLQQRGSRLVMRGVAGGYLRTFEFRRSLRWARQLILRYTQDEKATNAQITAAVSPISR